MTNPKFASLPDAVHPGEILREDVLPALGRNKVAVAAALGVSRVTLNDVLREVRPVSPDLAARLGKLLGNGGALWLCLQADYDLRQAETRLAAVLAVMPTWSAEKT